MATQEEITDVTLPKRITCEITLRDPSAEEVLRRLIGLYVGGAHLVVLRTSDPPGYQVDWAVDRACRRLPGLRLIARRHRALVLEADDASRPPDLARTLSQMAFRVDKLIGRALRAIEEPQEETFFMEVQSEEEELDGLIHQLRRQITLARGTDPSDGNRVAASVSAALVAEFLERVGDYATELVIHSGTMGAQERTGVIGQRLLRELATARGMVEASTEAFLASDPQAAHRLIDRDLAFLVELRAETGELLDPPMKPGLLPTRRVYLGYVTMMEAIERISLYAKSIAEVALDTAAAREVAGLSTGAPQGGP